MSSTEAKSAYIAGPFGERGRLRAEREKVRRYLPGTKCSWMDWPEYPIPNPGPHKLYQEAVRDFREIDEADLVIVDETTDTVRKGTYVELGYALAKGKVVWLVGRRGRGSLAVATPFHMLVTKWIQDWDDVVYWLSQLGGTDDETHEGDPGFVGGRPTGLGPGSWVPVD